MPAPPPHRWIHPQTIPRGFLRVYVLATLARGPVSGYRIMQNIEESTDGAWRPGPGTIYPLLKSLVDERLVSPSHGTGKAATVSYSVTEAGGSKLAEMRRGMVSFGRKEQFIMRLVSDLMPAESLVSILLSRSRDDGEFLRNKIAELPEPAKTEALKEVELLAESQLGWARSELAKSGPVKGRRASRSIR